MERFNFTYNKVAIYEFYQYKSADYILGLED
jgi:hypothetical protein